MKYLLRNYLLVSRKKLLISILSLSLIFLNNFLLTKFRNNIFGFVFSGVYTFFVYLLLINNINLSPLSPWGLLLVQFVYNFLFIYLLIYFSGLKNMYLKIGMLLLLLGFHFLGDYLSFKLYMQYLEPIWRSYHN